MRQVSLTYPDGLTAEGSLARIPVEFAEIVFTSLGEWRDRQRQRVFLSQLDDRLLDDTGVSRRSAREEAGRWT